MRSRLRSPERGSRVRAGADTHAVLRGLRAVRVSLCVSHLGFKLDVFLAILWKNALEI